MECNQANSPQVSLNQQSKDIKILSHDKILNKLLKEFEPLDFQALAYPQVKKIKQDLKQCISGSATEKELLRKLAKCKVSFKHLRILVVKNITDIATQNNWGLCKKHESIYLYNSTYWAEIDKEEFQKFLGEASEKMGVHWDNSQDYQFREQLFKQFLATGYLPTPESKNGKVLINLQNGTFEICQKERKLKPFDRSDFLTYQLPFEYDPQAKAPIFEAYLNRVLPSTSSQKVLSEYLGYIFIKHGGESIKLEKALILYGTGANGKSVFFEVVTAMFGRQNVSNYSLQSLTEEKGFYRAKIANILVNYASEISGKLEASLFKNMVSGEPVEACLKYGQPFTMSNYAKFIFNCNELPKDVEHTNAYFRRFLIIPFDVTIPEAEQDKELHRKIIQNELSGVFNWVLDGLSRLLGQEKFTICEASVNAVNQYKTESNSVQMFLNENNYVSTTSYYKRIKEVYQEYRAFCYEDGLTPFKKQNFIKQLKSFGFIIERVAGNQLSVYLDTTPEPQQLSESNEQFELTF